MTVLQRISLMTSVLVGLMPLPAYAQITQSAEQSATVSGNNNQVYQVINQTIINRPGRGWMNRNDRNNKPDKNRSDHPRNNRGHDDDDNDEGDDDD